jgi:hypothetical protein
MIGAEELAGISSYQTLPADKKSKVINRNTPNVADMLPP